MRAAISRRDEQVRVFREAIAQIFALQIQSGATIKEVSKIARDCIGEARENTKVNLNAQAKADVQRFGTLLRTWHRETKYLSREGYPRHLELDGRNSLKSLICNHYPKEEFTAVKKSLVDAGLIKRDSQGKWFPTTKHAVFPSLSKELLVHFSEGVARFIETMTRNVTARNKGEILFERSSKVRKLPVSKGREFREFANAQALAFLEAVDDWLESRVEEGKSSRERKCTAGVFAFAFMDDLQPRRNGPRR